MTDDTMHLPAIRPARFRVDEGSRPSSLLMWAITLPWVANRLDRYATRGYQGRHRYGEMASEDEARWLARARGVLCEPTQPLPVLAMLASEAAT